jgi:pimeloyl-ACP methyl ester carboxylesterase
VEFEERSVPVDGGVLGFDVGPDLHDEGGGRSATVLLLAGQSLGPEVFLGLRADLTASGFRVVVVHTRGTGRSDVEVGAWTTATFAADAVSVLDALDLDRAHVHGFSMGGRVATVLAARHPERVDRLVLGASGPGGAQEVPRDPEVTRSMRHSATPEGAAQLAELFFTPGWIAANREVASRFTPRGTPRVRRAHHGASTTHDAVALLPAIGAPTLVLHGADDAMTPVANAELLARRISGARLHVLPGARHGYLEEFRPAASVVVAEFLHRR